MKEGTARTEKETAAEPHISRLGGLDGAGQRGRGHGLCGVNGLTPKVEDTRVGADGTADGGAAVDAEPKLGRELMSLAQLGDALTAGDRSIGNPGGGSRVPG